MYPYYLHNVNKRVIKLVNPKENLNQILSNYLVVSVVMLKIQRFISFD